MSEQPSVKDLLNGLAAPTASFDDRQGISVGHYYNGKVIKEEVSQQTKMLRPGQTVAELEFWDPPTNARPKMQIILTLQNDAYIDEDKNPDGLMRVFLKGGQLLAAQAKARELGIESFLHGMFQITWTGTKPAKTVGFNDAKTYEVQFAPGVAPAQAALLGQQEQWAPSTPPVSQQAQAAPAGTFPTPPPMQGAPVQQQPAAPAAPAPLFVEPQSPTFPGQVVPQQQPAQTVAPAPDAAAAVMGIMGGVEITPLDPATTEKVKQLYAAGLTSAGQIVAAFAQYNVTVTEEQVNPIINGTPA